MKDYRKQIVDYFDGQMSSQKKLSFENELKNSEELRKLFEEFKVVYNAVSVEKQKVIDRNYSETIIPEFRARINSTGNNKPFTRIAYSISFAIIIFVIGLLVVKSDKINNSEEYNLFTEDLTQTEIEVLMQQLNADDLILTYQEDDSDFLDSVYHNYYSSEILNSERSVDDLLTLNDIDYLDLESLLSNDEMDVLYDEIINVKFF